MGADEIINPTIDDDISRVKLLTNGYGVDAVIITASSSFRRSDIFSIQYVQKKSKGNSCRRCWLKS